VLGDGRLVVAREPKKEDLMASEAASTAFAELLDRCARQPNGFTDDQAAGLLAAGDDLVWAAVAWLRCYRGDNAFLRDQAARVEAGEQLTPAQLRGVLNCLRGQGRAPAARRGPAGRARTSPALPAGLASALRGLLTRLEEGAATDEAARELRGILVHYRLTSAGRSPHQQEPPTE
jgi:hypothetical protein